MCTHVSRHSLYFFIHTKILHYSLFSPICTFTSHLFFLFIVCVIDTLPSFYNFRPWYLFLCIFIYFWIIRTTRNILFWCINIWPTVLICYLPVMITLNIWNKFTCSRFVKYSAIVCFILQHFTLISPLSTQPSTKISDMHMSCISSAWSNNVFTHAGGTFIIFM